MVDSLSSVNGLSSSYDGASQVDFLARRQRMLQKLMKQMDTNNDGTISKDEFVSASEKMQAERQGDTANMPSPEELFAGADSNGDQSLSVDELSTMLNKMHRERAHMRGGQGSEGIGSAGRTGMRQRMLQDMMKAMDSNNDGAVSKDEFLAAASQLQTESQSDATSTSVFASIFSQADTNGDGSLSKDELLGLIEKITSGHGSGAGPGRVWWHDGMKGAAGASSSASSDTSSSSATATDPADSNKDGEVSLSERMAYLFKLMARYQQAQEAGSNGGTDTVTDTLA